MPFFDSLTGWDGFFSVIVIITVTIIIMTMVITTMTVVITIGIKGVV